MSTSVSGILNLQDTNTTVNPAAGTLDVYAQSIAGYMMSRINSVNNATTSLQNGLAFNRAMLVGPSTGATVLSFNTGITATFTGTGSIGTQAFSTTNLLTSTRAFTLSTGATTNSVAYVRGTATECWRGNAAGLGGFFYLTRFGSLVLGTSMRVFCGVVDVVAAPTNIDPTTSTTPGKIGMAVNTNSGNWNIVHNVTGTAPTVIALGANFPVNTTSLYELAIYCPPNGSTISYQVTNLSTGNITSGNFTANIPAATTPLTFSSWISNNAGANSSFAISKIYLETDY